MSTPIEENTQKLEEILLTVQSLPEAQQYEIWNGGSY